MRVYLFTGMILIALVLSFVWNAHAIGTMTFLDHQKAVNNIVCYKMVECKEDSSANECLAKMNAISESNPRNKTEKVDADASNACLTFLSGLPCQGILLKTLEGPCAFEALKAAE